MTRGWRHLAACLAAAGCLVGAGCGDSGEEDQGEPLPQESADALLNRLREVEDRYRAAVDEGFEDACRVDIPEDSYEGEGGIEDIIASLPNDVDPELRDAVEQSFENLRELTAQECGELDSTETEPEPVEPPPVETVPEETVPEPPDLPPETVPEPEPQDPGLTVPEEDLVPPGQGGTPPGQGGAPPGQGGGAVPPEDD